MSGGVMLSLILATAPAGATPTPVAEATCPVALRAAVATGTASVPPACWRMGPIALGDTRASIEQALGRPIARATVTDASPTPKRYDALLYGYPWPPRPEHGRIDMRLVELLFDQDRLAAIDNAPGARIDGTPCATRKNHRADDVAVDRIAGPLLRFGPVAVGDRLADLARAFGQLPDANRSKDWYRYWSIPVAFDVDPNGGRIAGITIAVDDQALTVSALPIIHVRRSADTCAPLSVDLRLDAPEQSLTPRRTAPPIAR